MPKEKPTQEKERYDSLSSEARWRKDWEEKKLYQWDPNRSREETFIVDTPPPTVSGSLHVGHVFSYTQQDLLARFFRMNGMNIFYPMGWDDNGLPTERRVENFYGVRCNPTLPYNGAFIPKDNPKKGPADIVSRSNFIELCHQVTAQDEVAFKNLWQTLGLSVDWSLEYATINDHCRRISQLSFLKLFQEGHIYQATRPTMWDVSFRTAVAQAEAEDREVPSAFHTVRFGLEKGDGFEIATTRPELLAACVAIVVHPDNEKTKNLIGKKAITPVFSVPVPILADEKVDPEKGTGVVMVCTFGDVTDVEWWRDYKLPLRQIVSSAGRMENITFGETGWESLAPKEANEAYKTLEGLDLVKARAKMVALLKINSCLVGEAKPITHPVKFYEKGTKPLELLPTRQWFIKLLDYKKELTAQGEKIQWHPPYMLERYKSWVEGLNQDWCISRQRHFGVPIPVWYPINEEGKILYHKPILPSEKSLPTDPLSDTPMGYKPEQRDQPNGFAGDPDVQDTWATSSLSPQISSHWGTNGERHKKLFPADIRPQAHEIIRTWAFYTITKAWLHEKEIPWKHVVISGWVLDPNRKKMSKSKGNVITPMKLMENYSADAIRYWAARARAGVDTTFDETVFKVGKRLVTKLFNAGRFVSDRLSGFSEKDLSPQKITQELDQGFIQSLRQLVESTTKSYKKFDWAEALQNTETFFWSEFCDDYLELVKTRAYKHDNSISKESQLSALATLKLTFSTLLRLFAPVVPHITEEMWHRGFSPETSIHRAPWPSEEELKAIPTPTEKESYALSRKVLGHLRQRKGEEKVSIKTPIELLKIAGPENLLKSLKTVFYEVSSASATKKVEMTPNQQEDLTFDILLETAPTK